MRVVTGPPPVGPEPLLVGSEPPELPPNALEPPVGPEPLPVAREPPRVAAKSPLRLFFDAVE